MGNSQHIADWYSVSHIVHGMLIVLLGCTGIAFFTYPVLLVIAIVTGVAWEIVEHPDWVLRKFREVTVYQSYIGDSVLNSVMDYFWMWTGFFVAHNLATLWLVVVIFAIEVLSALMSRDCLTFTTIQVVYPLEAIHCYQQEINTTGRTE